MYYIPGTVIRELVNADDETAATRIEKVTERNCFCRQLNCSYGRENLSSW